MSSDEDIVDVHAKQLSAVYTERNMCVALIARMAIKLGYVVGVGVDSTEDPEWQKVIFIDLPSGQVSWHIHESELSLFGFLGGTEYYKKPWDGHNTTEKYRRVLEPGF